MGKPASRKTDAEISPGISVPGLARLLRYAKLEAAALRRLDAAYLIDVAIAALQDQRAAPRSQARNSS
jgi:hypothetical protein